MRTIEEVREEIKVKRSGERKIPVIELFGPTIQGEGLMSGTFSHFLRTGGCGLRCSWCDSMYAVTPSEVKANSTRQTPEEIQARILGLPYAPYVTLTGGDPCIHETLGEIIDPLNYQGMRVAVETQGQFFPDWLLKCDVVTFSPKGPSSGNITDYAPMIQWIARARREGRLKARVCIKVVVFQTGHEPTSADLEYALDLYHTTSIHLYDAFYFSAGTMIYPKTMYALPDEDQDDEAMQRAMTVLYSQQNLANALLAKLRGGEAVLNDKTHVGCQQHVLLWPDKERGV